MKAATYQGNRTFRGDDTRPGRHLGLLGLPSGASASIGCTFFLPGTVVMSEVSFEFFRK